MSTFFTVYFDNTVVYLTEFFDKFSNTYNVQFINIPTLKTLIVISIAILYFIIQKQILNTRFKIIDYIILISFAVYLLIMPLFLEGATMVWCYYLSHQLITIYISYTGLKCIKNSSNQFSENYYIDTYKKLLTYTFIFSFLIFIEDTIVIYSFDIYSDILVKIHNRNLCEDTLRTIYAIYAIKYLSTQLSNKGLSENNTKVDSSNNNLDNDLNSSNYIFYEFVRYYNLTSREEDVLKYLLQNKNNQEISDILFISIGTVKTHIHNIFQKVEVSKCHMLLSTYKDFSSEIVESSSEL